MTHGISAAVFEPDPRLNLRPGDITIAWCSKSGDRERKLFTGYSLICLHCNPEKDPERKPEQQ